MISHRLSTLKICDEIYYIEKGIFKDNDTLENLKMKYPEIESKKNKLDEKINLIKKKILLKYFKDFKKI